MRDNCGSGSRKNADFAGKVTGELHAFDRFLHYVVLPD